MAFNAGVTRYQKYKWLNELATKITAGSLKLAIYSTTTSLDANTDPGSNGATAQVYTTSGELTASGTGYTAGGFTIASAGLAASGNAYQLDFADLTSGSGTITAGTYGAMIYDTTDSNRALAICTVTVSVGSSGATMTFSIPANAIAIS